MVKLGKLQKKALRFYATYHSKWHSFENKGQTKRVIRSLEKLGLLTVDEFNDAKITDKGISQNEVYMKKES